MDVKLKEGFHFGKSISNPSNRKYILEQLLK